MRLFVDTEFTDLLECDLLSIGIVSEDGHEFYAESSDTDWTKSGDFARVAVLPKLRAPEANIFSETELSQRLRAWLASLAHGEQIVVSVDHPIDWEFFVYLARDPDTLEMPPHIKGQSIRGCVDPRDIEVYWGKHGRHAHHALHDARAIKSAFDAACSRDASGTSPR